MILAFANWARKAWLDHATQRELARLDDHALADIGVGRAANRASRVYLLDHI